MTAPLHRLILLSAMIQCMFYLAGKNHPWFDRQLNSLHTLTLPCTVHNTCCRQLRRSDNTTQLPLCLHSKALVC